MTLDCKKRRDRKWIGRYKVKLNGRVVEAFYADARRGVIRQYDRDKNGMVKAANGELLVRELRGHVTWVRL